MDQKPITILTLYYFKGFFPKYLALSLMGLSKIRFRKDNSIVNKFLGTGSGLGFSRIPDFGKYANFSIWKNQEDFQGYFKKSRFYNYILSLSCKVIQYDLYIEQSKGVWDKMNPYPNAPKKATVQGSVAILTRAKVKPKNLISFWKRVRSTNSSLKHSKGLQFSAGLGEWPFSHPITFSVWDSIEDANNFSTGQSAHGKAAKSSVDHKWFRESLFVRYSIKKAPK